jgi:hypothetical protein
MGDLARQAGYSMDYTRVDKDRWNEAARLSFVGRLEPMREVFQAAVSLPARSHSIAWLKPMHSSTIPNSRLRMSGLPHCVARLLTSGPTSELTRMLRLGR